MKRESASIFDVATYILSEKGTMSAMKLQKLCYYCQAWSLVWDDRPLFGEEFEAWANGPVCKELFRKTKGQYEVRQKDENGDMGKLDDLAKDSINKVLEYYFPHNAQWLSQLTHLEEPWKQARIGVAQGEPSENIITKSSMAEYYGSL